MKRLYSTWVWLPPTTAAEASEAGDPGAPLPGAFSHSVQRGLALTTAGQLSGPTQSSPLFPRLPDHGQKLFWQVTGPQGLAVGHDINAVDSSPAAAATNALLADEEARRRAAVNIARNVQQQRGDGASLSLVPTSAAGRDNLLALVEEVAWQLHQVDLELAVEVTSDDQRYDWAGLGVYTDHLLLLGPDLPPAPVLAAVPPRTLVPVLTGAGHRRAGAATQLASFVATEHLGGLGLWGLTADEILRAPAWLKALEPADLKGWQP